MNCIDFPESNTPLGAGGNKNTYAIRVMVSTRQGYNYPAQDKDGNVMPNSIGEPIPFYTAKLEYDENEIQYLRLMVDQAMSKNNTPLTSDQLDLIVKAIPPLYLCQMHSFSPVTLTIAHPLEFGHDKVILNDPKDN